KWMDEFNMDSAINNLDERIKYLADEKLKVTTVKESILNSLQKADSLIREKINQ
ncbi:MAG: viral A-type inclusion protein, partial [Bacteroidia bacterium]|nr:viral A-type inclusion protein [Bacteroidia bacterium]